MAISQSFGRGVESAIWASFLKDYTTINILLGDLLVYIWIYHATYCAVVEFTRLTLMRQLDSQYDLATDCLEWLTGAEDNWQDIPPVSLYV